MNFYRDMKGLLEMWFVRVSFAIASGQMEVELKVDQGVFCQLPQI
jgi:hypothetical protein